MTTDTTTFPLPGWSRDWSRPTRRGSNGYFVVQDRGYETSCWVWQGANNGEGYGRAWASGRLSQVHRAVYAETVGAIPEGMQLDHLCRVRACCNPGHLEPVTLRVNVLRGTGFSAVNATLTHCPRGHPYAGSNLYVTPAGYRQCRTCTTDRARRRRQPTTTKAAA